LQDFKLSVTGPQADSAHLIPEWFLAPVFASVRKTPRLQEFILHLAGAEEMVLKSTSNAAQGPEADSQASTDSSLVAFSVCFLSSASSTPGPFCDGPTSFRATPSKAALFFRQTCQHYHARDMKSQNRRVFREQLFVALFLFRCFLPYFSMEKSLSCCG
jgi:hypothetical protein